MKNVYLSHAAFYSPLGNDWASLNRSLRNGTSGIRRLSDADVPANFPVTQGAFLDRGLLQKLCPDPNTSSVYSSLARTLSQQCLGTTGSKLSIDGIVGGYREWNSYPVAIEAFRSHSAPSSALLAMLDPLGPLKEIANVVKASTGQRIASEKLILCMNACATGTTAVGHAMRRIQSGEWQSALVFSADLDVFPLQVLGHHLLGALAPANDSPEKSCRPFSADRSGFVKGEAAGLILLESEESVTKRGANALGKLSGYALTSDKTNLMDTNRGQSQLHRAMALAISDAKIDIHQIGYIKAHATGTRKGDLVEADEIAKALGDLAETVPVGSLKSLLGHSTIASGLMELICAVAMQRGDYLAPNLNLESPDPELRKLKLIGARSLPHTFEHALLNNLGISGQNSCLVLSKS